MALGQPADAAEAGPTGAAPQTAVVIDNGASTFLPLLGYLVESDAAAVLAEAGHALRLHAVITGGQALADTTEGLAQILACLPGLPVVVWLNAYFGRIEMPGPDGRAEGFEQSRLYRANRDRLHALIRLPEVRKETFGRDIEEMMRARLSFDEAIADPGVSVMARQRLARTWRALRAELEKARL